MNNSFEKQFSKFQANMVSVCLEYCKRKCEQIFIHIICENNTIFCNFFFRIDGVMCKKSKLLDKDLSVEPNIQKQALSEITNNAREIINLCETDGRPVPTEFKLIYDVGAGSLKAEYDYEPVTSQDKSDRLVSEEWFAQQSGAE